MHAITSTLVISQCRRQRYEGLTRSLVGRPTTTVVCFPVEYVRRPAYQLAANSEIEGQPSSIRSDTIVYSLATSWIITGFGYMKFSLASYLRVVLQVPKDTVISAELASLIGLSNLASIRTKNSQVCKSRWTLLVRWLPPTVLPAITVYVVSVPPYSTWLPRLPYPSAVFACLAAYCLRLTGFAYHKVFGTRSWTINCGFRLPSPVN